jgi:hypothetical protein
MCFYTVQRRKSNALSKKVEKGPTTGACISPPRSLPTSLHTYAVLPLHPLPPETVLIVLLLGLNPPVT